MIEKILGYIGYEKQLEAAYDHFKRGRSVVFTGPVGCGKTSMIAMSAKIMCDRIPQSIPMVIESCHPVKQFVLTLVEKLYRRKLLDNEYNAMDWETLRKKLAREHYRHSAKIALIAVRRYPGLFIGIDNLDQLTPLSRTIVLELIEAKAIVCGAGCRNNRSLGENFKRILYQVAEIKIPPMHNDYVRQIATAYVDQRGQLVEDRKHYVENIVMKANGNVRELDKFLRHFENEPVIKTADVRGLSQGAARVEVSLEWMIIAFFAFAIMLRFVSRATMNKQLYIITSVIAALYVLLRYFMVKGSKRE